MTGGGCMRDCRNAYCDAVRAGATAVQAWHFHCCTESGAPPSVDCEDLPNRIARFSLLAAEAREMCEARNWERLRDIWREFRGLVPLRFVSTVWREVCGESVAWGENRWTPVGPEVRFSIMLPFDPAAPPRIVFGDESSPGVAIDDAPGVVPWIERELELASGSVVGMEIGGRSVKAVVDGRIVLARRIDPTAATRPCDLVRPVDLRLDLRGDGWSGRIELIDGFDGNRMIELEDGTNRLGMRVRIDAEIDEPFGISLAGVFDEAFVQVPIQWDANGTVRIGLEHSIDGLELLPVDPGLESAYRSEPPGGPWRTGVDCAGLARSRAEAFLALHPDCLVAPSLGDDPGD